MRGYPWECGAFSRVGMIERFLNCCPSSCIPTMQSLRTRRSQAPRQAQRAPTTSNRLAKNNASNRDTRKSKVDDRIKKRMSMRYADISGPTELSIPDVPSLPVGIAASANRRRPGEQEELVADRSVGADESRRADDLERMLDDDNFDPDACMSSFI